MTTNHYLHSDDQHVSDIDHDSAAADSLLLTLVQSYEWLGVLKRILSHPAEAASMGMQGRTPLHVACDHDAPAVVVEALLAAYPEASGMVGTSNMNPLHITCSSQHASVHVVRVLLQGGLGGESSMRDVDGDTPLHAACRCDAPIEVLSELIKENPGAVCERDYEGLTPLLRLWVRYFVILGYHVIDAVNGPTDLTGELGEAWDKTELLLRAAFHRSLEVEEQVISRAKVGAGAYAGGAIVKKNESAAIASAAGSESIKNDVVFRAVHAAAAVDCPRPVVKIATIVHPDQLEESDEGGLLPLMIAASAPIFKVHDLSDEGYQLEDFIHGDNTSHTYSDEEQDSGGLSSLQPSVIEILLGASPRAASVPDSDGRLPLHLAIASNKKWTEGINDIIKAYPDAVMFRDKKTNLYPFMLAAANKAPDLNTIFEILRCNPMLVT